MLLSKQIREITTCSLKIQFLSRIVFMTKVFVTSFFPFLKIWPLKLLVGPDKLAVHSSKGQSGEFSGIVTEQRWEEGTFQMERGPV